VTKNLLTVMKPKRNAM